MSQEIRKSHDLHLKSEFNQLVQIPKFNHLRMTLLVKALRKPVVFRLRQALDTIYKLMSMKTRSLPLVSPCRRLLSTAMKALNEFRKL